MRRVRQRPRRRSSQRSPGPGRPSQNKAGAGPAESVQGQRSLGRPGRVSARPAPSQSSQNRAGTCPTESVQGRRLLGRVRTSLRAASARPSQYKAGAGPAESEKGRRLGWLCRVSLGPSLRSRAKLFLARQSKPDRGARPRARRVRPGHCHASFAARTMHAQRSHAWRMTARARQARVKPGRGPNESRPRPCDLRRGSDGSEASEAWRLPGPGRGEGSRAAARARHVTAKPCKANEAWPEAAGQGHKGLAAARARRVRPGKAAAAMGEACPTGPRPGRGG